MKHMNRLELDCDRTAFQSISYRGCLHEVVPTEELIKLEAGLPGRVTGSRGILYVKQTVG